MHLSEGSRRSLLVTAPGLLAKVRKLLEADAEGRQRSRRAVGTTGEELEALVESALDTVDPIG